MIFVTLGTQNMDFSRLLKAIDNSIQNGTIKEKVVVQAGYTKYDCSNMEIFDYTDLNKMNEYTKKASLIITHGGVGSILGALILGKPVIAAARLKKYNEHVNDHQLQIVNEFANLKYILKFDDGDNLDDIIKKTKTFKFKKYEANKKNFNKLIEKYISDTKHTSYLNKIVNFFHRKK